jgi:hypothetical protein
MKPKFILILLLINTISRNYAQKADSTTAFRFVSIKTGLNNLNEINLGAIINPAPWLGLGFEAGPILPVFREAYTPANFIEPQLLTRHLARSGYTFRHTIDFRGRNSVVFPSIALYFSKGYSRKIVDDPGRSAGTNQSPYGEFSEKYTATGCEVRVNVNLGKYAYLYTGLGIRKVFTTEYHYVSGIFAHPIPADFTLKEERILPSVSVGLNFLLRK